MRTDRRPGARHGPLLGDSDAEAGRLQLAALASPKSDGNRASEAGQCVLPYELASWPLYGGGSVPITWPRHQPADEVILCTLERKGWLELAEESVHSLITTFARTTGRDRSSPHHFANYWVTRNLSTMLFNPDVPIDSASRWDGVPAQDIRSAAKRLLASNDASLKRSSPKRVARFLED